MKLITVKANDAYRPAGNATPEPGGGRNGGEGGFPPPDDHLPVDLDACGEYPQPVTQRDILVLPILHSMIKRCVRYKNYFQIALTEQHLTTL